MFQGLNSTRSTKIVLSPSTHTLIKDLFNISTYIIYTAPEMQCRYFDVLRKLPNSARSRRWQCNTATSTHCVDCLFSYFDVLSVLPTSTQSRRRQCNLATSTYCEDCLPRPDHGVGNAIWLLWRTSAWIANKATLTYWVDCLPRPDHGTGKSKYVLLRYIQYIIRRTALTAYLLITFNYLSVDQSFTFAASVFAQFIFG